MDVRGKGKLHCEQNWGSNTIASYYEMSIVHTTLLVMRNEARKTGFELDFRVWCKIGFDVVWELDDCACGLETEHTGKGIIHMKLSSWHGIRGEQKAGEQNEHLIDASPFSATVPWLDATLHTHDDKSWWHILCREMPISRNDANSNSLRDNPWNPWRKGIPQFSVFLLQKGMNQQLWMTTLTSSFNHFISFFCWAYIHCGRKPGSLLSLTGN